MSEMDAILGQAGVGKDLQCMKASLSESPSIV